MTVNGKREWRGPKPSSLTQADAITLKERGGRAGLPLAEKASDWQPACSPEVWCHRQWATRSLTGSRTRSLGARSHCRDWDGSGQHPPQLAFKVAVICLKDVTLSPTQALQSPSPSFTYQAGLGTGLLSSILSILGTKYSACKTRLQFTSSARSGPQLALKCMLSSLQPLR